jgi:hypothetical protein
MGNKLVNKLSNFGLAHRMISRGEQLLNILYLTWKLIVACVWKLSNTKVAFFPSHPWPRISFFISINAKISFLAQRTSILR